MVTLVDGIDGTWTNGTEFDAGEIRKADAAIFSSGGVARGLDVTVTASDEVRVAPGSWVIDGDETSEGTGIYRGGIGSQVSDYLEPRDATYGRIDLVVARQYDSDVVGAHSSKEAAVEVLTGTPSANPSAPALPDLAIELARLDVPADGGGAVAVDNSRRLLAAVRGVSSFLSVWRDSNHARTPGGGSSVVWEGVDVEGGAALTGSGIILTFGPAGLYQVTASVQADESSGGYAQMWLKDADTNARIAWVISQRTGSYESMSLARAVRVAEGQRFELHLAASSGNNQNTIFVGGRERFWLTAARIA